MNNLFKDLLSPGEVKKAVIVSRGHFAHHLWNELSAIHKLCDTNSL